MFQFERVWLKVLYAFRPASLEVKSVQVGFVLQQNNLRVGMCICIFGSRVAFYQERDFYQERGFVLLVIIYYLAVIL